MPGGAIEPRLVTRLDIELRSAAPLLAGGDQLYFNHALCAKRHGYGAIESLRRCGGQYAAAFAQSGQDFRTMHDLADVRRSDFFFAFAHENQVHGKLAGRASDGVDGGQECTLGSLRGHSAASNQHISDSGFVDERGDEWW